MSDNIDAKKNNKVKVVLVFSCIAIVFLVWIFIGFIRNGQQSSDKNMREKIIVEPEMVIQKDITSGDTKSTESENNNISDILENQKKNALIKSPEINTNIQLKNTFPKEQTESSLSADEFLSLLQSQVFNGDVNEIRAILERVPKDLALEEALKDIINNIRSEEDLRRYAAEALVRMSTTGSIKFILESLLESINSGNTVEEGILLSALEAPVTNDGIEVMFDFLLSRGEYESNKNKLPREIMLVIRKSLLTSPASESIGYYAADLYRESEFLGNTTEAQRLLNDLSHPFMLTRLTVESYQENLQEEAEDFINILYELDDQLVAHSIIKMVPNQSVSVDDISMILFDWSIEHPSVAHPGLFMEYMSDSNLPPEERIVAAFGLAGCADKEFAETALEKAIESEEDPIVLTNLDEALRQLKLESIESGQNETKE